MKRPSASGALKMQRKKNQTNIMKTAAPTEAADAQQQQPQYATLCRLQNCFPPQPRYRGDDIPSAVTAARLRRCNLLLISSKQWKWILSPAGL